MKSKDVVKIFKKDASLRAKKDGNGMTSPAERIKMSLDRRKEKMSAKAANCYAVLTDNTEDTETTMAAVSTLKREGYDARIFVIGGTMHAFVFFNEKKHGKAAKLLKPFDGVSLSKKPVDKEMMEKIRKHL